MGIAIGRAAAGRSEAANWSRTRARAYWSNAENATVRPVSPTSKLRCFCIYDEYKRTLLTREPSWGPRTQANTAKPKMGGNLEQLWHFPYSETTAKRETIFALSNPLQIRHELFILFYEIFRWFFRPSRAPGRSFGRWGCLENLNIWFEVVWVRFFFEICASGFFKLYFRPWSEFPPIGRYNTNDLCIGSMKGNREGARAPGGGSRSNLEGASTLTLTLRD